MPTDRGMCCSFNLEAAEKLFVKGDFVESIQQMQMKDQEIVFDESIFDKLSWEGLLKQLPFFRFNLWAVKIYL